MMMNMYKDMDMLILKAEILKILLKLTIGNKYKSIVHTYIYLS